MFTALVIWSSGLLFTWVFDAFFQLARYPVAIYPPILRFMLTWILPVELITTIPAMTLSGKTGIGVVLAAVAAATVLLMAASWLFQRGLRH